MGHGAFGVAYCFVKADYVANMQSRDAARSSFEESNSSPPPTIVVKITRTDNYDCVRAECRQTNSFDQSGNRVPLISSTPMNIQGPEEQGDVKHHFKTKEGVYVSVCVMPTYDTDLWQFLKDTTNRMRMQLAGEAGFLKIAFQILECLAYLRSCNLWYEDLKLSNVLVDLSASTRDTFHCVLGDVGAIYDRDCFCALPGTFPSPLSITENAAVPGCLWCFGVFIVEYVVNVQEVAHMRALLYDNMQYVPGLEKDARYERACRARLNMKMLSWAIPQDWKTVHKLHEMCCPEGTSASLRVQDTEIMRRMRDIIDQALSNL
ncbi:hypothetical protein CYMTET_47740 [Cymbomonas tetramitiformis]|uniref:Protein kinase domain-containing protein n=1 Tax=Cymbomonas tetramitiformis TaxID=36881 RepID=A0AAE0BTM8_9CHLO|nr:hypothetical protein CYMTET_47740 [Cymbomonas tetramitiformis]